MLNKILISCKIIEVMDNINKLSIPATILIASVILGGFYYLSEVNKQSSIEKQQEVKLAEEKRIEDKAEAQKNIEAFSKSLCVSEAEESATDFYKKNCTYDCKPGQYYIANYDNAYSRCLQGKGLK